MLTPLSSVVETEDELAFVVETAPVASVDAVVVVEAAEFCRINW